METSWTKEEHPPWYRDISHMRCLILGSFPPHPSRRQYEFFYPNGRNRFWKILAELAGLPLEWRKTNNVDAVEERFAIMKKLHVGVQNLGYEIERKGGSALDINIRMTKYHDIISIVDAHPELTRILLPGFSAENSTARSFLRYIEELGIKYSKPVNLRAESNFKIYHNNRTIDCIVLNSTSTASPVRFETLLAQFGKALSSET